MENKRTRRRPLPPTFSCSVTLLAMLASFAGAPRAAADDGPFQQVYALRSRVICHVPRPGNRQKVLGFDLGHSFVYNDAAYWSVGDSSVDGNGDGYAADALGFRTGSVGRTTDLKAGNCVDVKLRTSTGRDVLVALRPKTSEGECLVWPQRVFEAAGNLYFFYGSEWHEPDCAKGLPVSKYTIGLASIGNPNSGDLAPARIGDQAYDYTLTPVKDGAKIYLFGLGADGLRMARVAEGQVVDRSAYEYWNGSTWVGSDQKDTAQAVVDFDGEPVTIAYNSYVGRYLMIYACDGLTDICARTARQAGLGEAALTGGWNAPTVILEAGLAGHAFWHFGYHDPVHPEKIYVSAARFPGRSYFVTLYEIDLGSDPPPAGRIFANSAVDFLTGHNGWSYAAYDPRVAGADLTPLTTSGTSIPDPLGLVFTGWVGDEVVSDASAPGVFGGGAWPSTTRGAGRVWTVPSNGTLAFSGEAWLESTLGDNAVAEVLLVRGATVTTLWRRKLVAKWKKTRSQLQNKGNVAVLAGDEIVFGIRSGNLVTSNALYDLSFFLSTIVFDPS